MALPKINTPTSELELPSTGETLQYRPFFVHEQKKFLMAQETCEDKNISRDMDDIVTTGKFGETDHVNYTFSECES